MLKYRKINVYVKIIIKNIEKCLCYCCVGSCNYLIIHSPISRIIITYQRYSLHKFSK